MIRRAVGTLEGSSCKSTSREEQALLNTQVQGSPNPIDLGRKEKTMAESEVKSAALWLGKLLVEQISNLDGVRDQVADLQTELNTLAAFLIEAVKTRRQDQLVQTVLSDARNVAYDCQDVIETYILKVARHGYEEYKGCHVCWLC